jgi:hypothetical protein
MMPMGSRLQDEAAGLLFEAGTRGLGSRQSGTAALGANQMPDANDSQDVVQKFGIAPAPGQDPDAAISTKPLA